MSVMVESGMSRTGICFCFLADDVGWPPVGSETLTVLDLGEEFEIRVPPLFVKGISVEDRIRCSLDENGCVASWSHKRKSGRSVVWVMHRNIAEWSTAFDQLLKLGCHIVSLKDFELASIDIPMEVRIDVVDEILEPVKVAGGDLAFPSMRHQDVKSS